MASALIPLADGFEDIEAVTIIDVLRRGGVEVTTAAIGSSPDVRSAHGMTVRADALFPSVSDASFDAIVLPGGGEGTQNLLSFEPLLDRIRRQSEEGLFLCAICAAPIVLSRAGVLGKDVQVTCYPSCLSELQHSWNPAPVIADGNIITGQAPGSAMLFSLVVLQHLTTVAVADAVASGMVTDVLQK